MRHFTRELARRQSGTHRRRWVVVPYDQLTADVGPLSREDPRELGIVCVESPWKAGRRPYHRQKLALVLANQRHFALEQAARGVAVRYLVARGTYTAALQPVLTELGPARLMQPAERELRVDLAPLIGGGLLQVVPHEGWLTTSTQFRDSQSADTWRMDAFYRHVRAASGIVMVRGKPEGGKWSFDAENRRPWRGTPPATAPPTFAPDEITREVGTLIESRYAHHPGELDLRHLPATKADAEAMWTWARESALPHFGPFEDAMAIGSRTLFHTRVSGLVNLHRLLPSRVVADAVAMNLPLSSREGFVRQVLGWREYMHHVHEETDGFRRSSSGGTPLSAKPGDGGFAQWAGKPWAGTTGDDERLDGGAAPSFLGADRALPPAFWGQPSGLACLDHVVRSVWDEAYSHHITRLMVLSNIAALLDVSPRELTDWFWVAYLDAYDWVVEPNVLAMSTFATGPLATTKPYVAGAPYINRMSDYCRQCQFDPKSTCPLTPMYWAYLDRHQTKLRAVPRMFTVLTSLDKRAAARRTQDARVFEVVSERLSRGAVLTPDVFA